MQGILRYKIVYCFKELNELLDTYDKLLITLSIGCFIIVMFNLETVLEFIRLVISTISKYT